MGYSPPPDWCRNCWSQNPYQKPSGKIGLFGGRFGEWLAGEIGDCSWLQWLIKRDCEKCGGTGIVEYRRCSVPNPPAPPAIVDPQYLSVPGYFVKEWHADLRVNEDPRVEVTLVATDPRPIFGMR